MNISKSKIKTYESCPLNFKWSYLDKKIPDIPEAAVTKIGINIHDIFDKFYDNINIEKVTENPYEYFVNSMKVLPQYQNIFNLFCMFQARRWIKTKDKTHFIPLLREKKIINNDEVGIIDAVFWDGNEYLVLDYKGSVNNPSNLRFELNFYKKLVDESKILDKPIRYIASYGYKDGSFFCEDIKDRSYNLMLKKIENFKNIDFKNIEYPKMPGYHCSYCRYPKSCQKV